MGKGGKEGSGVGRGVGGCLVQYIVRVGGCSGFGFIYSNRTLLWVPGTYVSVDSLLKEEQRNNNNVVDVWATSERDPERAPHDWNSWDDGAVVGINLKRGDSPLGGRKRDESLATSAPEYGKRWSERERDAECRANMNDTSTVVPVITC